MQNPWNRAHEANTEYISIIIIIKSEAHKLSLYPYIFSHTLKSTYYITPTCKFATLNFSFLWDRTAHCSRV